MARLRDLFASYAVVQIVDFLSLYDSFEYTKSDIIQETGISRRTLYQVWPLLEKFELVKPTRTVGNATLYTFNKENKLAKLIDELNTELAIFMGRKIAEKEAPKVEGAAVRKELIGPYQQAYEKLVEAAKLSGVTSYGLEESKEELAALISVLEKDLRQHASRNNQGKLPELVSIEALPVILPVVPGAGVPSEREITALSPYEAKFDVIIQDRLGNVIGIDVKMRSKEGVQLLKDFFERYKRFGVRIMRIGDKTESHRNAVLKSMS